LAVLTAIGDLQVDLGRDLVVAVDQRRDVLRPRLDRSSAVRALTSTLLVSPLRVVLLLVATRSSNRSSICALLVAE
jgi:hypothetical protein